MEHKNVELLETKAEGQGVVRALTAVFNNIDRVGDRLLPGSFTRTLKKWRESGRQIPVIFSHADDDPMNFVGTADPHRVLETEAGLVIEAEFDLENPVARQVHSLLKKGSLPGWSFGYIVPKGGQRRRDGVNEISEVELFEVGPTLVGANDQARTLAVKAFEVADATAGLTESERETYERLREEHRAEQQAKAKAEQEAEAERRPAITPVFQRREDAVFSIAGIRVKATERGWIVQER